MTVVGVRFHTHELGKKMRLRHFTHSAGNQFIENPWLGNDGTSDSEAQTFRLLRNRQNVDYVSVHRPENT